MATDPEDPFGASSDEAPVLVVDAAYRLRQRRARPRDTSDAPPPVPPAPSRAPEPADWVSALAAKAKELRAVAVGKAKDKASTIATRAKDLWPRVHWALVAPSGDFYSRSHRVFAICIFAAVGLVALVVLATSTASRVAATERLTEAHASEVAARQCLRIARARRTAYAIYRPPGETTQGGAPATRFYACFRSCAVGALHTELEVAAHPAPSTGSEAESPWLALELDAEATFETESGEIKVVEVNDPVKLPICQVRGRVRCELVFADDRH
jgi:hypothetical protein